ncbi:hypothetical protein [Hydrocarboniphaga effusa]|uniref:hypothetical protein n=1 Tax=Hydrocarboniphaga effusa TaxID=243629 RepID=UPI00398BE2A8
MKPGLILLVGVFAVFYVYPFATTSDQSASWYFYGAQGFFAAFLCALFALDKRQHQLVRYAAAWGFFEQFQVGVSAVLSMVTSRDIPLVSGVLFDRIGPLPYAVVATSAIFYLWRRHDRKE